MAIVTTDDKHYAEIAKALRHKCNSEEHYTPEQMAYGVYVACDIQYQEGMAEGYLMGYEAQHTIKTGTFTSAEDTSSIHLDIPTGAKLIEIVPDTQPSQTENTTPIPLCYLLASEAFQSNNAAFPAQGAVIQYYYNNRYHTSFYPFDTSEGFSVTFDTVLVFKSNTTYRWTAHYWPE